MNDDVIVPIFVVIDDVMCALDHRTHPQAGASDSEVLTVAVVAACQFANHQERALEVMRGQGYLSGSLSVSRFNRRLARPRRLVAAALGAAGGGLCHRGGVRDRQHAGSRLPSGAGVALPQGAWGGVLRLLCSEEGEVFRLAAASDRHADGHPGLLRSLARVAARLDAGA